MKVEIERRPLLCALIGLAGGILAFELWWAWIALLAALIFVSPWRSRVALTVTAIVGYAIAPSSTPATIESSRPFAAEARIAEPPQLTERPGA